MSLNNKQSHFVK